MQLNRQEDRKRRPIIMLALPVYIEPNEADIILPQCVILDNIPAFWNQTHEVQHNSVGFCPMMPALPFTKMSIWLCD